MVLREDDDLEAERFADVVTRNAVSVLNLPPSYHHALGVLGAEQRLRIYQSVRLVAFGGDALPVQTLREVQAAGVPVFNAYGPTEACVNCSLSDLSEATDVGIGQPLDGTALLVLDAHHRLLPAYCSGQLSVLGVGLSSGYLSSPSGPGSVRRHR